MFMPTTKPMAGALCARSVEMIRVSVRYASFAYSARGWRHHLRKIVECNGDLAAHLRRRTLRAIHSVRDRHYPRLQKQHATY